MMQRLVHREQDKSISGVSANIGKVGVDAGPNALEAASRGPRLRDFSGRRWVELTPAEAQALQVGSVVQVSARGSMRQPDLAEVVGHLVEPLQSSDAGATRKVTRFRLSTGRLAYYDVSHPEWLVQSPLPLAEDERTVQQWPECLQADVSIRATDEAGLFVNLLGFGIKRGCFRDDCSHSDHFDTSSPATCARTCGSIRACRWWSFWPGHDGGTCWLRRHNRYPMGMAGSVSASVDCRPPAGSSDEIRAKHAMSELTLFALAKRFGSALTPRHPLFQWDLLRILQDFGKLTPSQVQAAEPSALQRSALRFAARAQKYLQESPES